MCGYFHLTTACILIQRLPTLCNISYFLFNSLDFLSHEAVICLCLFTRIDNFREHFLTHPTMTQTNKHIIIARDTWMPRLENWGLKIFLASQLSPHIEVPPTHTNIQAHRHRQSLKAYLSYFFANVQSTCISMNSPNYL